MAARKRGGQSREAREISDLRDVYRQPEMPADLSPADWSILMRLLELLKRTVPSNDDRPPGEIIVVLRKAPLAHFADK